MDPVIFQTARVTRQSEITSTLQTLATALSVTADLPTSDELAIANRGDEQARVIVRDKIDLTLIRVLSALKVREDAS